MCVQTIEGCEDQKLHRDAGHKDSLSVLLFIGDGAININGIRKEMVANSAVVFTNTLPHGGVSHNGGIRVFFYIDFGWFVPENSDDLVVAQDLAQDLRSCARPTYLVVLRKDRASLAGYPVATHTNSDQYVCKS